LIWPEWGVPEGSVGEAPMPGVCWIGLYSVMRIHTFIPIVWFWRERREAQFFVAIKSKTVNIMKAGLEV
jgi:hypothetical protein